MAIYTSYYGNRQVPEDAYRVQVSNSRPENYHVDLIWKTVFPDYDRLVKPVKEGIISFTSYTYYYLNDLDENKVLNNLKYILKQAGDRDVFLLCYCGKDSFCHRKILASFITEKTGLEVKEYEGLDEGFEQASLF